MLSRDLWDSMAKQMRCAVSSSGTRRFFLKILNHELIDSSALGYVCLEKISGATTTNIAVNNRLANPRSRQTLKTARRRRASLA